MKRKDILTILIPSFIFALAWIGFSVYHSFITSTIPESVNMQISPITPDFDTKTIADIKTRKIITPITEIQATANTEITPTPAPVVQTLPIISSSSAQQATAGGNLQ